MLQGVQLTYSQLPQQSKIRPPFQKFLGMGLVLSVDIYHLLQRVSLRVYHPSLKKSITSHYLTKMLTSFQIFKVCLFKSFLLFLVGLASSHADCPSDFAGLYATPGKRLGYLENPLDPLAPRPSTHDPRPSTLVLFFDSLFIKSGKQCQVNRPIYVRSPSATLV